MRKILFILAAMLLGSVGLHAGNTITYTASERLSGRNGSLNEGETTFGPAITSHTFSNGTGTIICAGEITTIRNDALAYCSSLTSITIPNSVTTIGEYSFYSCTSLKNVTIPNSVTEIGHSAFRYCGNLVSVTIGNSVRTFGDFAFGSDFSLTLVKVNWTDAQSIVPINEFIFVGIANEAGPEGARLVVPKGTSNLYRQANVWKEFGSIIEPDQVITYTASKQLSGSKLNVGATTFGPAITKHEFSNGTGIITCDGEITMIGSGAFVFCSSLTSITLPNSVIMIGDQSFNGCSSLTSMVIPNSVTTIREMAFRACTSLTTIVIPASVKQIDWGTFMDSPNLQSVYCYALTPPSRVGGTIFTNQPTVYTFNTEAYIESWSELPASCFKPISAEVGGIKYELFGGNKARVIGKDGGYTGNVVIPQQITFEGKNFTVTEIRDGAFTHSGITSISLPASITKIGMGAFEYCGQLQSIILPPSVSIIGDGAFQFTGLTYIIIPASVERIGSWAFQQCPNLKEVIIPSSSRLTSIGMDAFWQCSNLSSVTIPNSVTEIGQSAFFETGLTSIYIPASVKKIGSWAFKNCTNLKDLQFAERTDAINIATYAFENMAIEDVVIPDWMTVVPEGLFYANSKLEGIYLHEGVQKFNYRPFGKCNNLKYIISMPTTPPDQDRDAFEDLNDTVYVYVPSEDAKTKYENDPKWKQHKFVFFLDSITYRKISNTDVEVASAYPINGRISVPAVVTLKDTLYNVAGIGNDAIRGQTELRHLILPPTMKYIGNDAFNGCTNLIDVKLPVELQTIGYYAFYGCSALDSIVIPDGVQILDAYTFYRCKSLTHIVLPDGLRKIWDGCFGQCPLGQEIIVPEGVDTIGKYAFEAGDDTQKEMVITLPSTLEEIKDYAFLNHQGLKEVRCLAITPPNIGNGVFSNKDTAILYVPNRDVMAKYRNSQWGTYKFKFTDLMAEANKEYLRELAGSNDTAKAIANAYCDSIDNRATTTQQVQDYTNTAAMMMDKYVFPEYKVRLCDALDSIAKTVLDAQPIAEDYRQRIMDTHFRGEAENLFAEGCAKIDALKQLNALKEKCGKALQDMAQDNQNAQLMAGTYAELIDGAATQEEVYQLYEEGKKRIAKTLFIDEYWIDIDGCYYLGGFIEEK